MAPVNKILPPFTRGCLCFTDPACLPDIGKVLAGIQVPPEDNAELDGTLKQLGYTFVEETDNVVYKRHLRG
jgi:hypothetical protein